MLEVSVISVALLTGFISGLLLSIPLGPINLTIMNEGARRGFKWAFLVGLGATAMDTVYCAIAFTSFSALFRVRWIESCMEVFSFAFMLFLGIKFLMATTVVAPLPIGRTARRIEERLEGKFHAHSAFMTGMVRVACNAGVLVFWTILAANFMSRGWVRPRWDGKLACIAGVALGTGLWFLLFSRGVSLGHGKFSKQTLLRIEHLSGVALVVIAFIHGCNIAWQLTRHQM